MSGLIADNYHDHTQACVYARFLCQQAGVKFVLGEPEGKIETLICEQQGSKRKVTGIKTCDGQSHSADLVVVACKSAWKLLESGPMLPKY